MGSPDDETVRAARARYPDHILLFQNDQQYESYGRDAVTVSQIIGRQLTRSAAGRWPCCAVPIAGTTIPRLLRAGYSVAVSEEKGAGVTRSEAQPEATALSKLLAGFPPVGTQFNCGADFHRAYERCFRGLKQECFLVAVLDQKNRLQHTELAGIGTLTEVLVHPREVFASAIAQRAASIAALHNHPSGNPRPSPQDKEIAARLAEVGSLVGIHLLDFINIGRGHRFFSFVEGHVPFTAPRMATPRELVAADAASKAAKEAADSVAAKLDAMLPELKRRLIAALRPDALPDAQRRRRPRPGSLARHRRERTRGTR
ncbi:MAG: hypothetical protein NTW87_20980 [Planctomycetota bacterium]|nr:hypothetical protein [Planctomycetota bacterium]